MIKKVPFFQGIQGRYGNNHNNLLGYSILNILEHTYLMELFNVL